jgi:hypothetical protein
MTRVNLIMTDILENKEVLRTIDISNILVADNSILDFECNKIGNESQILKGINNWIIERGNKQHETILELKSYTIN